MSYVPMKTTTWDLATADATAYVCVGPELTKSMIRYLQTSMNGRTSEQRHEHLAEIDPRASEAYTRRRQGHSLEAIARHQKCRVSTVKEALGRALQILGVDVALPDPGDMSYGDREKMLRQRNPLAYETYLFLSSGWTLARIGETLGTSTTATHRLSVIARNWMQEPQKRASRERRRFAWLTRQDETDVPTEVIQERMRARDLAGTV